MSPDLTPYFRGIGKRAGAAKPEIWQVANVNHLDNFVEWIRGDIEGVIVDAVSPDDPAHVEWFNQFCATAFRTPTKLHPMVREIAAELYEEHQQPDVEGNP